MVNDILKQQVYEVIKYSQNIEDPKIDELLNHWYVQKHRIRDRFLEGKNSYTYPNKVSFELNNESKRERYDCFIEYVANILCWDSEFVNYLQALSPQDFYANTLPFNYILDNGKKIQEGSKIIKSFKYFLGNENLLADIQNKASELIQENKVEGYLTFSVHPLDFLSSSENTFNWRSCHALDGEYRVGNLSYMLDQSTIICFLQSDKPTKLPHFPETVPWNNKKWRCLLHFDTELNVVFAGRQYPFTSSGALDVVRQVFCDELVKEQLSWRGMEKPKMSYWHNDYISDVFSYNEHDEEDNDGIVEDSYCVINSKIYDITKIVTDAPNSKHFNDLLRSSYYTKPYYMFKKHWNNRDLKFVIGSEAVCLKCGQGIIDDTDAMLCPSCKDEMCRDEYNVVCDYCHSTLCEGEEVWIGDTRICSNCAGEQAFQCNQCGEWSFNENKHYIEEIDKFVCDFCYDMYLNNKEENSNG